MRQSIRRETNTILKNLHEDSEKFCFSGSFADIANQLQYKFPIDI